MRHTKIAALLVIWTASLGLLVWALVPEAGAGGVAHSGKAGSATANQGQAVAQEQFRPQPVDEWTPRPPLERQYAPETRTLALSTTAWTPIGPSPLAVTTPANANFNVSGRIAAIAAHPTDANTIYVATAGGGVWKTTNGGTTWTPLTDTQMTLSMGAIAIAKTNPSLILAGTGEANNGADNNFGRGILRSADAGATWTLNTGPGGVFNTNRMTCSKLVIDPGNANVAYAAMSNFGQNGIFAGGITGIYKTTDGGLNWVNVTAADGKEATFPWSDAAVDPNTTSTVYGAVGYIFGTANNGGYKSINSAVNSTLLNAANAPFGATFGRLSLAISKASNANVLYIAAEDNTTTGGLARFVRSDNAGVSFNLLTVPNYMGGQGWYDQTLIVDPTSSAIVYAAGAAGTNSILRSTTSGASWTDIHTGGAPNNTSPHPDHHGADFDSNGKFLDGNDGGLYRLDTPATPSWSDLNGNLNTIQFTGIGLHPTNANIVIGGSQDNGTELYTGNVVWLETDGGDGGYAKFSSTNGTRVYHQIPIASFGVNFFRRSDDGGNTWVTKTSTISADTAQNFYASFSVDPGNGDRVLYCGSRVWETTNGGDSWTPLSTAGTAGFNSGGNALDAIGIAPSDTNTIYAATGGGFAATSQIFVTTNHGAAWTEHDLPAGNGRVNYIEVDPVNAQIAYAVVNRFSANGHVFRTTNGGTSWNNISGNLPNLPVWSIQIDNTTMPNTLYIGADDGVYSSTDLGVTWGRFGTGLPNAQAVEVALNKALHILGVATHGRGAWEIATSAPPPGPLCTNFSENFDSVVAPALPGGWMATNVVGPAPLWVTSTTTPDTAPNDAFVDDPDASSDKDLDTPGIPITSASARVTLRHSYNLETSSGNFYDGAVLEVSSPNINGGAFTDITDAAVGGSFVTGGYVAIISGCCGNPLAGRMAWGGDSGGYITTTANLGPNVAGQTIRLRFRMASDSSVAAVGWRIDTLSVTVTDCPLQSAVSRKVHGGAGTFDVNLPLTGTPGVECRSTSGNHQIVLTFANSVMVGGGAAVTSGTGHVSGFNPSGSVITVNLTGVTNAQTIALTLNNVIVGAQLGSVTIPMGVLAGDTSGNGAVTATDVSQTKLQSGLGVTAGNFREDVVVSGTITASDVSAVKLNSGTSLP